MFFSLSPFPFYCTDVFLSIKYTCSHSNPGALPSCAAEDLVVVSRSVEQLEWFIRNCVSSRKAFKASFSNQFWVAMLKIMIEPYCHLSTKLQSISKNTTQGICTILIPFQIFSCFKFQILQEQSFWSTHTWSEKESGCATFECSWFYPMLW